MAAMCSLQSGRLVKNLSKLIVPRAVSIKNVQSAYLHRSSFLSAEGILLRMPSLSPTMVEGTIVKWLKNEGDPIVPGDALCDIQTDKAVVTMDTEEEGTLAKILVGDNSADVPVGKLIAVLAPEGEDWKTIEIPAEEADSGSAEAVAETPVEAEHDDGHGHETMWPSVRLLLEQYGISAASIPASGPKGVLLKGDVLKHIKMAGLQPLPPPQVPPPQLEKAAAPAAVAPTAAVLPAAAAAVAAAA